MPSCNSNCWLCDLPVRFDTYKGCSHGCTYCFARRFTEIGGEVGTGESASALRKWIDGKRTDDTAWCDWDIPLRFGALSDPFQPIERTKRRTYTNEGETVLDNCMGSGSTGVACKNTGRDFIGIELNPEYYLIAEQRIGE